MNPTLVKIVRPADSPVDEPSVAALERHLLGGHEPPFRRSVSKASTSYVRVIHDQGALDSLLTMAEPLVSAAWVSVSLNGRTWKPVTASASNDPGSRADLRDPGAAAPSLGPVSDLRLDPARATPVDPKSPARTIVVSGHPQPGDPPLPHEDRIRKVFPGTGGDEGFSPRPQQIQALSHIIRAVEGGATDVILQMPTGGGKSVIGHALSKIISASPTYYTVDKVALGDQYTRSLPVVHRIAGRRNYPCHLQIDPASVDRSSAEIAEREAGAIADNAIADGDPDPFLAIRRKPKLTADAAPCAQVRVSGADGDRPFPCRFSQIPKELSEEWRCPDCGSEEILHYCRPAGRWVDVGDNWDTVSPWLAPTRVCPYYRDRFLAANSASVITTNDYYFRYPQFKRRTLAVYDECDRLSSAVLRSYSVDITSRTVSRLIDVSMTALMSDRDKKTDAPADGQTTLFGGARTQRPSSFDVPADIREFDPDHHLGDSAAWELDSGRIVSWLRRLLARVDDLTERDAYPSDVKARVTATAAGIRDFLDTVAAPDGVVATDPNYYWDWGTRDDGVRWLNLRPILVGKYARSILEARSKIRLYMSATVGDVDLMIRELGLDPSRTAYVRFDYSDFPVANRPIMAVKGGVMSYRGGKGRQPHDFLAHAKIIHGIATRMYPDRKGLVLPFSGAISEGVREAVRKRYSSVSRRLIADSADMGSERYAFIEKFRGSTGNRILISTYANEGFDPIPTDVDPDRSVHWLVVAKVPYPSLTDMRVRILRDRHPDTYGDAWYEAETARTWLQMIGRIHRSADDTGRIFVLDPAFPWAYKKWRHAGLIPKYVDDAVDLRE